MIEILPIKLLTEEDGPVFGKNPVTLGKLHRAGFPVANGLAVTAPELHLSTVLEHFDFGSREVFEQSLTLVKKEIFATPLPEKLVRETRGHKKFLQKGQIYKSVKDLWQALLNLWIEQIKQRLWNNGFYPGITKNLDPQVVIFVKKMEKLGSAYFDPISDDVFISQNLKPFDMKKIHDLVILANKKLFIPHEYEWVIDSGVKISGIKQFTQILPQENTSINFIPEPAAPESKSAVKVFSDFYIEGVDGLYISSEKDVILSYPDLPIYLKFTNNSDIEFLDFLRHKKNLTNIHIVIPFVRSTRELLQIKRDLAAKKLTRKNSLQLWTEVCTPENIINLEEYLEAGIDGVVLNLDQLIAFINGFDPDDEEQLAFYKNEVEGLLKFLEDGLKLLHKAKIPFIADGNLIFDSRVLEFLVEIGVYGIVAPKYEAPGAKDLLYQVEKRMILRRS